jgi:ribitol 2-dehydrogenase
MDHPLSNKVVVVTGASSGIGRATARALARLGCRLALAALPEDRLDALAEELGPETLAVATDVTVDAQVTRMAEQTLERFRRIDALFANAGIYVGGQIAEGDTAAWARMLDVNVMGVLRCVRAVLPSMIAQRSGDIVMTSSISGYVDIAHEPVYSASKHAVQGLAHTVRRQVSAAGIRVGTVAPGIIANELTGITDPAEIERRVNAHTYLRSEDVAEAVVFMLSRPPHVTIRDLVILPQNQEIG